MNNFMFSLSVVMPLFSIMMVGYILRRINLFTDDYAVKSNKVCFEIFLPCMILYSIYTNRSDVMNEIPTVVFALIASAVLVVLLLLTVPFLVKDKLKIGAMIQGMFRSNCLIFGVPLVMNLYGAGGVGPISVLVAVIVPFYNFITVIILSVFDTTQKTDSRMLIRVLTDLIKNPLIIAAITAIFISVLPVDMPEFLLSTVKSISNIATPLALMALGATFRFRSLQGNMKYLIPGCIFKMIIMPAAMVAAAAFFGFRDTQLVALMVLYATPVAVSSYVMTKEAHGDHELAGQLVVMSTVFSIFTIFFFIYALKSLAYI